MAASVGAMVQAGETGDLIHFYRHSADLVQGMLAHHGDAIGDVCTHLEWLQKITEHY